MSKEKAVLQGCLWNMLSLALIMPMWYAILWGLLEASQAPTWCWIVYFMYLPSAIVVSFGKVASEFIAKTEGD